MDPTTLIVGLVAVVLILRTSTPTAAGTSSTSAAASNNSLASQLANLLKKSSSGSGGGSGGGKGSGGSGSAGNGSGSGSILDGNQGTGGDETWADIFEGEANSQAASTSFNDNPINTTTDSSSYDDSYLPLDNTYTPVIVPIDIPSFGDGSDDSYDDDAWDEDDD